MKYFPKRYYFIGSAFLITLLLYIDRVSISLAEGSISSELSLTARQMGWVMGCFSLGYALFQVPSGILGDRYGPRRVMTAIMGIWSLFTALTGTARNYFILLAYRFIFGAGEAGAFPNIARAAFSWIPLKERGIFQGINFSGSRIGAAFALPLVAYLIGEIGWRTTFYFLGAIGVVFALAWYFAFRNSPEEHPAISQEEREDIIATRQKSAPTAIKLTGKQVLGSGNVWLAMGQYVSSNFIFFFCLTWMFPYIKGQYNLEMLSAGFYAMVPLLGGAAGNWFSGFLVDRIYRSGRWSLSRKIPAIIGFTLVIAGVIPSLYMSSVGWAVFFLTIAIFGADMSLSPSWSFCMDIGKQHSGTVSGTMNMAGNLGAFITSLAFPYLFSWTGSYNPFFFVAAGLSLLAIICWLFMDPRRSLIENLTECE